MSKFTDELMQKHGVKPEGVHLPAGGVAVFGRSGTGKSSLFYNSRFVRNLIIADTGSLAHKLYCSGRVTVVDTTKKDSPIQQVTAEVERCVAAGELFLLDSFTTLQFAQVAWYKRGSTNQRGPAVNLKDHQTIVGYLRDLSLVLAQAPGFTVFNTAPGGRGKTPDGQEVVYPAGCITGYPSLNGTNANSETVLARWGTVWGVFQGFGDIPRGLYVPGKDIRPEAHGYYSPLKDPYMVVRETSGGEKPVMAVPDMRDPGNAGRCFADELLVEIAAKFRRAGAVQEQPVKAEEPKGGGKGK